MEARSPSAAHQRSGPQCLCAQAPVWPPLGLAQASGPRPPWSGLWLDLGLGPTDEHVRARAQPVQLCLNLCFLCLAGRAPPSRASAAPAAPDSVPQYTAGRVWFRPTLGLTLHLVLHLQFCWQLLSRRAERPHAAGHWSTDVHMPGGANAGAGVSVLHLLAQGSLMRCENV
jgi:hypothetical protein